MQKNYVFRKTHDVNKEKFAQLLLAAKGGRTMKDFADICGANPSTFTRIVKQANKGASSPELLEAIAQNAASNSNVTLQDLADANGYTLEQESNLIHHSMISHLRNMEHLVRTVVYQELIERAQEVSLGGITYNVSKRMLLSPDALIMTDAFGRKNEEKKGLWFVDSMFINKERIHTQGAYASNVRHRAFNTLSRFAFISMAPSDFLKPTRFSLVVTDQEAFDIIVEEFGETVLTFDATLILIDSFNRRIINEFMFPYKEGGERTSFFMTTDPINYELEYFDKNADYETEDDE